MAYLSVVICSRKKSLSEDFLSNIENTIGCKYELIVIDNSENRYSIFEAYNQGIKKSSYSILVFIHDDLKIHTYGWGAKIMDIFNQNSNLGLLGVAGSKIKLKIPSAWWENLHSELAIHIIQHYPFKEKEKLDMGFENGSLMEVAILDGVFMALKKQTDVWFNEKLSGFHNYDQSLSIDVIKAGYKIFVTNQILIEHFSLGKKDQDWFNSTLKFHKLYKSNLPLNTSLRPITTEQKNYAYKSFIENCRSFGNKELILKYWLLSFKMEFLIKFKKVITRFIKVENS